MTHESAASEQMLEELRDAVLRRHGVAIEEYVKPLPGAQLRIGLVTLTWKDRVAGPADTYDVSVFNDVDEAADFCVRMVRTFQEIERLVKGSENKF